MIIDSSTRELRTSPPVWSVPIDEGRIAFLAQGVSEHVRCGMLFGDILQGGLGLRRSYVSYPCDLRPMGPIIVVALGEVAAREALGIESGVRFGRRSWGQWFPMDGRRVLVAPSLLEMLDDRPARGIAWKGLRIIPDLLKKGETGEGAAV